MCRIPLITRYLYWTFPQKRHNTDLMNQASYQSEPACAQDYYLRTLAYLCAAATIAMEALSIQSFNHPALWVVVIYAALYPHLLYLVCRNLAPNRAVMSFLLDAINVGLACAITRLSLVPCLMFCLMLCFHAAYIGGIRLTVSTILATVGSTLFWVSIPQLPPNWQTPVPINLATILMTSAYLLFSGVTLHKHHRKLSLSLHRLMIQKESTEQLAHRLRTYLSPAVWDSFFGSRAATRLEARRKKLTVFFSDIKGFTELSEELESEALTDLLNHYLAEMTRIAMEYGGTIDKFVGDSVIVFFGDPDSQGSKKDALGAVSMAIAMRKQMKVLRQQWRSLGIASSLEIRMGINTGYCTVGVFGAGIHMDYTIIGHEVNLASRLENSAQAGEILISQETYALVKDIVMCRDKGQLTVKGFSRPIHTYQVMNFRQELGKDSAYLEFETPGFSMFMDTNIVQGEDKQRIQDALSTAQEKLNNRIG